MRRARSSTRKARRGLLGPAGDATIQTPSGPTGFRTPFREDGGVIYLIDQRRLPDALVEYPCRSAGEVAYAIREMIVRGAPAIGQVAAIGLAMAAEQQRDGLPYARKAIIRGSANALINARPTAVNLRWAVDRVVARYVEVGELNDDGNAIADALRAEADAIVFEATTDHGRLAGFGLAVLPVPDGRPVRILTHCNTGPLACGQYGTALGVIQAAHHAGREVHVLVDETRPYLQGARLTTWELAQAGVPHSLLPDVAAGHLMATGEVDVVLVGADRVAANGDTANKVGTYPLAVLAARHGIPFYVCAPTSSVDLDRPGRRGHPDRGAQPGRGPRVPRRPHRAGRHRGPQPGLRHHAGRAHHRVRDRGGAGHARRSIRASARHPRRRWRAGRRCPASRPTGRPRPTPRPRPWEPADGHGRARAARRDRRADDDRQDACSARSSNATGCTRRTRSAISRSASSRGRAGAWPGTATRRSRSSSNTTGRRPSRSSRWVARTASRSSCAT